MIRPISASETISLRWAILRPGFPRESAIFEGDHAPETRHFGAFHEECLVGVASIYQVSMPDQMPVQMAFQLRGMATIPELRGQGFGRELLKACAIEARAASATVLWCNARTSAAAFYQRHGWSILGEPFEIQTVGPHFRMLFWIQ